MTITAKVKTDLKAAGYKVVSVRKAGEWIDVEVNIPATHFASCIGHGCIDGCESSAWHAANYERIIQIAKTSSGRDGEYHGRISLTLNNTYPEVTTLKGQVA